MRGVGGADVRRHHEEGGEAKANVWRCSRCSFDTTEQMAPINIAVAQHGSMDDVFVFLEHVKERIESSIYFLALQYYSITDKFTIVITRLLVCSSHGSTRQFSQHMQAGCEWREP